MTEIMSPEGRTNRTKLRKQFLIESAEIGEEEKKIRKQLGMVG
jgi:hypothetical protein